MVLNAEEQKLDELSAAIDTLNDGAHPKVGKETQELAEVALLLKMSLPPPMVLDELVGTLSGELAARKRRRRFWLASGAAGSAAAALLVFALSLNPAAPPPMAIPPAGSVAIEKVPDPVSAPAPEEQTSEQKIGQVPAAKPASPQAAQPSPPASRGPAGGAPAEAGTDNRDRQAAAAVINAPAQMRTMLAERERAADKVPDPPLPAKPQDGPLTWAGRQPDAVSVDEATGAVRQVYGAGSDREVIITQRATSRAEAGAASAPRAAGHGGYQAAKRAGQNLNRVTLGVKGYVVTVEGSQSEEELWKIAQSLE